MTGLEFLVLSAWVCFMLFGSIGLLLWVSVGPVAKKDE
ncbi:hypothetical protein X824_gp154 [Escherichia phage 4MG]|uniref:Hyphothetical protein n=1 Tax=Escherichia phage 4MG TaxID=1391428 RepID=V5KSF5_9CAUD|nr:hypothetical protein X824_gp154 [Escherichia phage 4MG]AGZ17669.1 hyphothetical protein [Escherichia phage 4MG]